VVILGIMLVRYVVVAPCAPAGVRHASLPLLSLRPGPLTLDPGPWLDPRSMPIYEYACEHCGVFEEMQRITDPPLSKCPKCKRKVRA
jgi:putative FmdB family regulatory protein